MLTNVIERCIATIDAKRDAQLRRQSARSFAAALGKLNTVAAQIAESLACMDTLEQSPICPAPVLRQETREALLSAVSDCGKQVFDGTLQQAVIPVLEASLRAAKGELGAAWREHAGAFAQGARGYLSMLGNLTDAPQRAKELDQSIEDLVAAVPSVQKIQLLLDRVAEAQALTASFQVDEEIERFLNSVNSKQATIADLTPRIRSWLEEADLLKKLRIQFP